jgi:hypothetical protein
MGAKSLATFFIVLFLLLTLISCGNDNEIVSDPSVEGLTGSQSAGADNGPAPAVFGDSAQWPEYIPDAIPVLEGSISLVMGGSDKVRIFYQSVTDRQIEQYLDQLEKAGFALEYLVYSQEGVSDSSEEKLKRGEFDAVDITKGDYHMRLEAGGDTAVYDIYTNGFEAVIQDAVPVPNSPPTAVPLQWPDPLVPPPESCELTAVLSLDEGQYVINCQFEKENTDLDYIQALQAVGFSEQTKFEDMNGTLISITLEKEGTAVTIMNSLTSALNIQIRHN